MKLIERCQNMITEFDIPITKFCKKILISQSTFYAWRNGQLKLSTHTLQRIDDYLSKYGF